MSPYEILEEFRAQYPDQTSRGFAMSRLILIARVIPEDITPELRDPGLAERLRGAITRIKAHEADLQRREAEARSAQRQIEFARLSLER